MGHVAMRCSAARSSLIYAAVKYLQATHDCSAKILGNRLTRGAKLQSITECLERSNYAGRNGQCCQCPHNMSLRHDLAAFVHASINLHGTIDFADKDVACVETNSACQAEEAIRDDEHVPKVHEHGHRLGDVKLAVQRRRARAEVSSPPPVVVLGAQLEITQDDGNLGTGDDQNQEHQSKEACKQGEG
eukprot:350048-Chlamydomonas_euryale.AAC.2